MMSVEMQHRSVSQVRSGAVVYILYFLEQSGLFIPVEMYISDLAGYMEMKVSYLTRQL